MSADVAVHQPRTVVLADGRGVPGRRDEPTRRVFSRMVVGTMVTLFTLVIAGYFAGVRLAERQVLANIADMNEAVTHSLVEPIGSRLLDGDEEAMTELDAAVREHLLPDTAIERFKLWTDEGVIVYSDKTQLVGKDFDLSPGQLEVLHTGRSSTQVKDLDAAKENEHELSGGDEKLLEVYSAARTNDGRVLLVESYLRLDVLQQRQRDVLISFAAIGLLGLSLFAVSQLWLASANLRWLQRERARLAQHSAEVVDEQRRRMARDLHDGVVQDLIGAAYLVNGGTGPLQAAGRADAAEALRGAESTIRTSIRSLRSLLIDVYPATLRNSGLRAAVLDLVAPLQAREVEVDLDVPDDLALPEHLEATLYRAAREAVRNAAGSGHAGRLAIAVRGGPDSVELTVWDNGTGFDPTQPLPEGHLGLRGLADEAAGLGGLLEVTSSPGQGTELRLVLPR